MDYAILVLISVVLGSSVAGGLATVWSLHRRLYRLEHLFDDQEAVLRREVKRRAADGRWAKEGELEKLAQSLQGRQKDTGPGLADEFFR